MKTIDIFGYSFSAIRLRKLRAALTTLGVVIGIAAIVALLSITQGLQSTITHPASTRTINKHVNCYSRTKRPWDKPQAEAAAVDFAVARRQRWLRFRRRRRRK